MAHTLNSLQNKRDPTLATVCIYVRNLKVSNNFKYERYQTCSYCVDFVKVGTYGHLFVQLRTLCEVRGTLEITNCEDIGATF